MRVSTPQAEGRMEKLKVLLTNVDRFIEKIVVGEKAEKYSRTVPQAIWIHYRDIEMLNDVNADFDIKIPRELYDDDHTDELRRQFKA